MFETTFKNLDDTLRKDDGCSTEMDYIEQTSWVLFLSGIDFKTYFLVSPKALKI